MKIELETVAVIDALADLQMLCDLLPQHAGGQYRQLEGDIEALTQDIGRTSIIDGGDGVLMMTAPDKVSVILRRARELGVI